MNIETIKLHLAAGEKYGRDATCGPPEKPKVKYRTEEVANLAVLAMMRKGAKPLEAYPCFWCDDWHIGREMTDDEWESFQ